MARDLRAAPARLALTVAAMTVSACGAAVPTFPVSVGAPRGGDFGVHDDKGNSYSEHVLVDGSTARVTIARANVAIDEELVVAPDGIYAARLTDGATSCSSPGNTTSLLIPRELRSSLRWDGNLRCTSHENGPTVDGAMAYSGSVVSASSLQLGDTETPVVQLAYNVTLTFGSSPIHETWRYFVDPASGLVVRRETDAIGQRLALQFDAPPSR